MTQKSIAKIVTPGLIGNVLEWYDFALYGYFAVIISPLFFPSDNPTLSLITTMAVFAIGFIMRPLGAILFGHLGDRFGRKNSLATAILLMAIPTTLIGLLPGYDQIGITAPLLLIGCRLLQGLAVGGEFTGSIVYILEHVSDKKRGFYGSLAMSSAFLGLILGSLAANLVGLTDIEWAWRIPFLFSIFLGGIGLYLRLGMPESPEFEKFKKEGQIVKSPLKQVIKHHPWQVLSATALVLLPAMGFYLSFVYLPTYLHHFLHVDLEHAQLINTLTMAVVIFAIPCCGLLSDKIGKRHLLLAGSLAFMSLSIPLYVLLDERNTEVIIVTQALFALLVAISYAAIPATLFELFPPQIRFTGLSLPYNLANAFFGGTAPLIATSLIHFTGSLIAPGIYLTLASIITLIAAIKLPAQT